MTISDTQARPLASVSWKAAVWAGLVAGAVFLMLEMAMLAMTGESPWGPPRMMAAIVLGEGVLPPPATFDITIVMVAMMVHFALSLVLAFALAFALTMVRVGFGFALLIGAAFGLAVYAVNFYGFTALFPWFAMARNMIGIVGHLVFGVVLAGVYVKLARQA